MLTRTAALCASFLVDEQTEQLKRKHKTWNGNQNQTYAFHGQNFPTLNRSPLCSIPVGSKGRMKWKTACTSHKHKKIQRDRAISGESQPVKANLKNILWGSAKQIKKKITTTLTCLISGLPTPFSSWNIMIQFVVKNGIMAVVNVIIVVIIIVINNVITPSSSWQSSSFCHSYGFQYRHCCYYSRQYHGRQHRYINVIIKMLTSSSSSL